MKTSGPVATLYSTLAFNIGRSFSDAVLFCLRNDSGPDGPFLIRTTVSGNRSSLMWG